MRNIRTTLAPKQLFNSKQYGFSQVVTSGPGTFVFVSGQVAWDEHENIVGEGDLEVQVRKAIENLSHALEAAGGTLENIVMLRIYSVDYKKEDGPVIAAILNEYFGTESPPASTWLSVKGLANEKFLIEIEAQAVV